MYMANYKVHMLESTVSNCTCIYCAGTLTVLTSLRAWIHLMDNCDSCNIQYMTTKAEAVIDLFKVVYILQLLLPQ